MSQKECPGPAARIRCKRCCVANFPRHRLCFCALPGPACSRPPAPKSIGVGAVCLCRLRCFFPSEIRWPPRLVNSQVGEASTAVACLLTSRLPALRLQVPRLRTAIGLLSGDLFPCCASRPTCNLAPRPGADAHWMKELKTADSSIFPPAHLPATSRSKREAGPSKAGGKQRKPRHTKRVVYLQKQTSTSAESPDRCARPRRQWLHRAPEFCCG